MYIFFTARGLLKVTNYTSNGFLSLTGDQTEDCKNSDEELLQGFRDGCPITFSDVKCALRRQKQIKQWLEKNNKFKILITGKMGTGKTTLVRGLKEQFVPEEDHLEPHTVRVTPHRHEHDDVDFTFFDTPGLKDTVKGENDYSYLKDMVENNEKPDLLIFALKMDDAYFREEDKEAVGNITDAFGWKVWKNAMFVLTFANKVQKLGHSVESRENKVYFSDLRDNFSLQITELLREQYVPEDVANNIPVTPVGLVSQPRIESDECGSWVDAFWKNVFSVLKASRQEQVKDPTPEDKSEDTAEEPSSWTWWWCSMILCASVARCIF